MANATQRLLELTAFQANKTASDPRDRIARAYSARNARMKVATDGVTAQERLQQLVGIKTASDPLTRLQTAINNRNARLGRKA